MIWVTLGWFGHYELVLAETRHQSFVWINYDIQNVEKTLHLLAHGLLVFLLILSHKPVTISDMMW